MQKLRREQQKQQSARASRGLSIPYFGARFEAMAPLSPGELDAVVDAVERNYLNDEMKHRVGKITSQRDRHLQILRAAMQQLRRERGVGIKIGPNEMALVNTMVDAIPKPAIKAQLASGDATVPRRPFEIRRQLGQIIGHSILAEWQNEIEESPATTAQADEMTKRWVGSVRAERRAALEQRLQSEQGAI